MMPNTHEMLYSTTVLVDDMNRHYRDEMMRQAEHARLVRVASETRETLSRKVMAWAGHQLVASGHYLLNRAEPDTGDLSLASLEQR